jgi:Skp family chaperone for outer membrane proteins
MPRFYRTGGVLLILVLPVVAGRTSSQPRPAPQAPRTRVALLNLAQVFKHYQKVITYTAQNKKIIQPYEEKIRDHKHHIEVLTMELERNDLAEAKRAEYEKKRKDCQRRLEEVDHEAKTLLARRNEEQLVIVYKEVTDASNRHARAQEIDLVMHYSDSPVEDPEHFNVANVNRKIQARGLVPVSFTPGMDITKAILADLNDRYRAEKD